MMITPMDKITTVMKRTKRFKTMSNSILSFVLLTACFLMEAVNASWNQITQPELAPDSFDEEKVLECFDDEKGIRDYSDDPQPLAPTDQAREAATADIQEATTSYLLPKCCVCYSDAAEAFAEERGRVRRVCGSNHFACDTCLVDWIKVDMTHNHHVRCPGRTDDNKVCDQVLSDEQIRYILRNGRFTDAQRTQYLGWYESYLDMQRYADRMTQEEEEMGSVWEALDYRKCPACRVPTEWGGVACMHMTCWRCQHSWCWECRQWPCTCDGMNPHTSASVVEPDTSTHPGPPPESPESSSEESELRAFLRGSDDSGPHLRHA